VIHGERIRHARELKGWTQTELAKKVGLGQSAIAQFEGGSGQPRSEVIEAICFQTGFPPAFFETPPVEHFPQGTLLFRSRASMTTGEAKQAYSAALTVYEMAEAMRRRTRRIPHRIPRIEPKRVEDIERAAEVARSAMGLNPDGPIANLVLSLERAGVLVLGLWEEMKDRDAFSLWAGVDLETPVIVLSPGRPGDRVRFSLAHELGHLVMHQAFRAPRNLRELERQADRFAGAFLLPASGILSELGDHPTLTLLATLKARWRVSMQALILRAQALGVLSPRQVKYLYQQMQQRGWRKAEPVAVAVEKPRAVHKMAELLYGVPVDARRVASEIRILRAPMVRAMLDVHASQADLAKVAG